MYIDKTFFILEADKPKLLGPVTLQGKQEWLLSTAKELFRDYVLTEKENYNAFKITYNREPVGVILYHMSAETIYLALILISAAFQKKGITTYLIDNVLPVLHPACKRYEVLTRRQNGISFLFYHKTRFSVGDIWLVGKYGYSPLYYMGFYKER